MQQYLLDQLNAECENPGIKATEIKEVKGKGKLAEFQRMRHRGAVLRARVDKFLLGEQPTSMGALADEKKFALSKEISAVEHDGVLSHYKDVIKTALFGCYERLFGGLEMAEDMTAIRSLIQIAPELKEDSKESMEQPFTLAEIEHAIDGLAAHKTPGPDGLCAEFYQIFKK